MGSWPPERKAHHAAVAHASVEPFDVWHTRTCGCPVRWVTVRRDEVTHSIVEAVIVLADPVAPASPDVRLVRHDGDGFGTWSTAGDRVAQASFGAEFYRPHPTRCAGGGYTEHPLPDPVEVVTMQAAEEAIMFDAPIPDDFMFAGPPAAIPPPAPTGLHAPPAGVEAQRAATEEAIERVDRNAPDGWRDEAVAAIRDVASRFVEFTADDVWDTGLTIPPTPSALGPAFRAAQASGYCEPTPMVQASRYAQRHRQLKVWRSCLVVMPPLPASPLGFAVEACSSCRAPMTWVVTQNGKSMPVDALGDPAGNLLVTDDGDPNSQPTSRMASRDLPTWPGVTSLRVLRTVSHFATCPNRDQHRNPR